MRTRLKCTLCGRFIIAYKSHPIINFTNIEQPVTTYVFCTVACKKAWIQKKLKKHSWRKNDNNN